MKRWIKASSTCNWVDKGSEANVRAANDVDLSVGERIIDAWNAALAACNLYEEEVHTLNHERAKKLQSAVERELRNRNVDLSFKTMFLPQDGEGFAVEGMKVGGNVGGIANDLIRGCIKEAWEPVDMTSTTAEDELDYAASHDVNVYIGDKYGYCDLSTPQAALRLFRKGNKTQYSGYGSQGYIDDTKVTMYTDYFGNIKVDRRTVRYD